jgi:enamine deaminase RidA (YjgF/YER057c/UK114 family)
MSMTEAVEERLTALGLRLPEPAAAVGNYVGAVRTGNLVFVSGHGPFLDGQLAYVGRVDSEVTLADARAAAELVMLNCLRSLKDEIGSLDRVVRCVRLFGMVNSDPSFTRQPEVMDGASNLLTNIFGDRGAHARAAVGMVVLPLNIPVEIELLVEVR